MERMDAGNITQAFEIGKDRIYEIVSDSYFAEFVESSAQFDVRGGIFKNNNGDHWESLNRERN